MEILVAFLLLAVTCTAVAGIFINTLGVAKSNTQRTTAANLGTQQMEAVRAMRALDIPDGHTVLPAVTIGGTVYTVARDAQYVTQNSTGSACTGPNAALPFKRVTVTVTWPNMGSVKPVRTDTLRAVGLGEDDGMSASDGAVAVAVMNASAQPVSGIPVTVYAATGNVVQGTQTTGTDGCVVFVGLPGGTSYDATANTLGYVGTDGAQLSSSGSFGVVASQVTKATVQYDRPGSLLVTATSPKGYSQPSNLNFTLRTSVWIANPNRAYPDCSLPGAVAKTCFVTGSRRSAPAACSRPATGPGPAVRRRPAAELPRWPRSPRPAAGSTTVQLRDVDARSATPAARSTRFTPATPCAQR